MLLKELLEIVSKIRYKESFKHLNNFPPFDIWFDNFLSSLEYLWISSTDSISGRELPIEMDKNEGNYTLLGTHWITLEQEVPNGYWLFTMSGLTGEFSLVHMDTKEELFENIEKFEKHGILSVDQISEGIAIKDNDLIKYTIAK